MQETSHSTMNDKGFFSTNFIIQILCKSLSYPRGLMHWTITKGLFEIYRHENKSMNFISGHGPSLSVQFTLSNALHFRWPVTILALNEFIMVKTHTIFIHFSLSFFSSLCLCVSSQLWKLNNPCSLVWGYMTIERQQNAMSLALYNSLNTNT